MPIRLYAIHHPGFVPLQTDVPGEHRLRFAVQSNGEPPDLGAYPAATTCELVAECEPPKRKPEGWLTRWVNNRGEAYLRKRNEQA